LKESNPGHSIQVFDEISKKLQFAQFSQPQAQMSRKSLDFPGFVESVQKWYQIVAKDSGNRMIPLEAGLIAVEWRKTPLEDTIKGILQISSFFRHHVGILAVTRSKMGQFRCGFQFQV
jgi:hypothetical protein